MQRNPDGTFKLLFKTIENERIKEFTEIGTWWVQNGVFYEFHEVSNLTDTYKYKVLNNDLVKFEIIHSELDFNKQEYSFVDKRKK
ncbi:MAG: hypothetical protein IPJ13_27090 [Saprospiraceae bacterium]|nr:hypothetical protein [Saprospiraceae bacterium]